MPEPDCLVLPHAPLGLEGPVKAWEQPILIQTYEPEPASPLPMFIESRVYQGSSGRVYPLPLVERIAQRKQPRWWKAIHIENEYLRATILPELGGRIHVGLDKTNNYDFIYRQNVIKPALVGLAGSWASGGVEFNWPQHHRPATYMPVETVIEYCPDGAAIIWCSDYDPFQRMQATHGICLHPGKAVLELKVRLYNRTAIAQTFLWWANTATRVHELYQSFFPPDVHFVADHARRAMSSYPLCSGTYYGVDYSRRAAEGTPAEQAPRQFQPRPELYAPNDLRWYANIPVPTSYMALGSTADFLGGYDHCRAAGIIHVANHHIAPGKKQWTWGNHEFGYSWDRQLTDADGPYIELMAGVFTDNQPDFSFLGPGETKTFSQFWYPIREIGIAQAANTEAALHVELGKEGQLAVSVYTTSCFQNVRISVATHDRTGRLSHLTQTVEEVSPLRIARLSFPLETQNPSGAYSLTVCENSGREILSYSPSLEDVHRSVPAPATEPPPPSLVESAEELFLIGQHLAQYRHATRAPIDYWREALRRDPGDSRCHHAMGFWHLERGEFAQAENHFKIAIARLTAYNANPSDCSAFYYLGLVLRYLQRESDAYVALYKATWDGKIHSSAHHALAEIDAGRQLFEIALQHLERVLRTNLDALRARNLKSVLLRKLGREQEASDCLAINQSINPTDPWTQYLLSGAFGWSNQARLDIAFDYLRAGLFAEAAELCRDANLLTDDGTAPIFSYLLGFVYHSLSDGERSRDWLAKARTASPAYCFPSRLEEMQLLEWAAQEDQSDNRARCYLGNLYYHFRRYEEAITSWEDSLQSPQPFPALWRNLGIAYFNVRRDTTRAIEAFDQAFSLDPADARVFFERDQLWKRAGTTPVERLKLFQQHRALVDSRDDLSLELISLKNQARQHQEADKLLSARTFQPWEGGEGLVLEQHARTKVALGRLDLMNNDAESALKNFQQALDDPPNLGEASHLLANRSNVYFWLAVAYQRLNHNAEAEAWWEKAAAADQDFREMNVQSFSAMSFYRALSLQRLGKEEGANNLLRALKNHAGILETREAKVDYFATSLPNTLLFREDLARKQRETARFFLAQALLGMGELAESKQLLGAILASNPSNGTASDFMEEAEVLGDLALLPHGSASIGDSRG